MAVRAGITTGFMESGPSEANWFLARNAGRETVTSDQFLLEETEERVQACISLLLLPEAKANRKIVL